MSLSISKRISRKLFGGFVLGHNILPLNPAYLVEALKSLDEDLNKEAEKINLKFNLNAYPSFACVEGEGRVYVESLIRSERPSLKGLYDKNIIIETHIVYHNHSHRYNFLRKVDGPQIRISEKGGIIIFESLPMNRVAIPFGPAIKNLEQYYLKH